MTLVREAPAPRVVPAIAAAWAPPLAWGAGLVEIALGAGAVVAVDAPAAARALGAPLVALGLAGLVWGAASLRAGRRMTPRAVSAGAIAAIVLPVLLLVLAPGRTSVLAVATAVALVLGLTAVTAADARIGARPARPARAWLLVVVAVLLSLIVTPAISAVQAAVLVHVDGSLPPIPGHGGH